MNETTYADRLREAFDQDSEALTIALSVGYALLAYAVLLYFVTSSKESSGFRILPATSREWGHYVCRTLIVLIMARNALAFAPLRFLAPPLIFAVVVLLASAYLFQQAEPDIGLIFWLSLLLGFVLICFLGIH